MGIRNFSEGVFLVDLPLKEPHIADELIIVNDVVGNGCDFDVIVDFSKVEILTSVSICNLMILKQLLSGLGHRLVLCSVPVAVKGIFAVTGLAALFDFTDDKFTALKSVQHAKSPTHSGLTENPEPV